MANNIKGICGNGKSYLIQPNELFGQDEVDNLFVPPEDLNIYVELTTTKKSRSVIDFTDDGVVGVSSEKGNSTVSFIDGTETGRVDSDGNPKKSLTTSYTELTTVFNKTADTEKFGIASINIEFNSAMAPLIRIEFVDIRGASLFNTGNPPKSEYSSFFDLPYPIFTLKVKGYYGKTVKYCLHLTKWNARFNTKSGNFEITADFIGYTYAMLSDMLLGYLRAITKTTAGYEKFLAIKSEMRDPDKLITINELLNKIEDVNKGVDKIEDDDVDVADLEATKELSNAIDGLEDFVNEAISEIQKPTAADAGYVVFDAGDGLFGVLKTATEVSENQLTLSTYKDAVKTRITTINDLIADSDKLYSEAYTKVPYFGKFIYDVVYSATTTNLSTEFRSVWPIADDAAFDEFGENFGRLKDTAKAAELELFDFSKIKGYIRARQKRLEEKEKALKDGIATKIQGTVIELLGFEPTIKNLFRIFTVHAEIFMECLKDVSKKAQDDETKLRKAEFDKLADKTFDIKKSDTANTGELPPVIYPWPLYRKKSEPKDNKAGNLEEAWLGEDVTIPNNVPELVFVEDLLKGLLSVSKEDAERDIRSANPDLIVDSWFPVSPLDTPIFGVTENPYKTATIGDTNNPNDPLKLMMSRAFTFMGSSNRTIAISEIKAMATLEAHTANAGIKDKFIKAAMITGGEDDEIAKKIISTFLSDTGLDPDGRPLATAKNPTAGRRFMWSWTPTGGGPYVGNTYYLYSFIKDLKPNTEPYFIPFNGDLTGSEFFNDANKLKTSTEIKAISYQSVQEPPGLLFLSPPKNLNSRPRPSQYGATFFKIVSNTDWIDTPALLPNYPNQTETLKSVIDEVKTGQPAYLDYGDLYRSDPNNDAEDIKGFNLFGINNSSKFAFTTINAITYGSAPKTQTIYAGGATPNEGDAMAAFYQNPNNNDKFGCTSLASRENSPEYISDDGYWAWPKGYEMGDENTFKFTPNAGLTTQEPAWIDNLKKGDTADYYHVRYTMRQRMVAGYMWGSSNGERRTAHADQGKNRELFNSENVMIPHVDFSVDRYNGTDYVRQVFSLFGSQLYFEQRQSSSPKSARAYLYLHSFPWNSLFTVDSDDDGTGGSPFDNDLNKVIENLFGRKAAFIKAPRLWCAWMGGVLWRLNTQDIDWDSDDIGNNPDYHGWVPTYKGGSGKHDPITWGKKLLSKEYESDYSVSYVPAMGDNLERGDFPRRYQYSTHARGASSLSFTDGGDITIGHVEYKKIDKVLQNLPSQIKLEFIKVFFEFVNSDEWATIRENYEIHPKSWDSPNAGTTTEGGVTVTHSDEIEQSPTGYAGWTGQWVTYSGYWRSRWANINNKDYNILALKARDSSVRGSSIVGIKKSWIQLKFPKYKEYEFIQPIRQPWQLTSKMLDAPEPLIKYNWDVGYKSDTETNNIMVSLFKEPVWIANASYKPWVSTQADQYIAFNNHFSVESTRLALYIETFIKEFKVINKVDTIKDEEKELLQQVFNTMDSDAIRLNIYRHCKALYDKWIAGSPGNILTACGTGKKEIDTKTIERDRVTGSKHRLIDSFRFVNRGFNDLGDTYLINPNAIHDIVVGNMNQSFYDLISKVLGDNNFNFIALPAFIDYNDVEEMKSLFKPEIFNQDISDAVAGPTFLCVYVGQTSNKLDLGEGSAFPNDGFDFRCKEGQLEVGEGKLPLDMAKEKADHEHNVVAFAVNYGHQNQNIFTDIKLDQQEFGETDESLQITDSIAQNGSQSNRTMAGQNLWNVYQVRSYSTEITAMGNAMIQPMMYFQLNNIPMFHGAYMITKASHKITPNHMTTTFKGSRTRFVDTPLMDSNEMYMSMLGAIGDGTSTSGSGSGSGSGSAGRGTTFDKLDSTQATFVNYEVKETNGLKYQEKGPPPAQGDNWAMEAVGKFMQDMAAKWHTAYASTTFSDTLYINNFGAKGGGTNKTHGKVSLHSYGRACDLRPMMKTKAITKWNVGDSNYSSEQNKKWMQMAIDLANSGTHNVTIDNIILNDTALIAHFKGLGIENKKGGNMVISTRDKQGKLAYHNNHIHIEFDLPTRVGLFIEQGVDGNGDKITSNGVAGSVSTNTIKSLSKAEMKTHVGKI